MRITAINTNNKDTTSKFAVKKYANTQNFKSNNEIPKHVIDNAFAMYNYRITAVVDSIKAITIENYNRLVRDAKFFNIPVDKDVDTIPTLEQKLAPKYELKNKVEKILIKLDKNGELVEFESGTYHQDEVECALKNCNKTDWENEATIGFYRIISRNKHNKGKEQTISDTFVNLIERFNNNAPIVTKRESSWMDTAVKKIANVKKFINEELTPEKGFPSKEEISKICDHLTTNCRITIEPFPLSAITK